MRSQLLHTDTYFMGVRVSQYGSSRRSSFLRPPYDKLPGTGLWINIPENGQYGPANDPVGGATLMQASLQLNYTFDTNRKSRGYIADVSKGVIGAQPATYNFQGDPSWNKGLSDFYQYLITTGWNIRAIDSNPIYGPFPLVGIVADPVTTQIGIIISAVAGTQLAQGIKIQIQHLRPAKGTRNPTMNGTWVVQSVVNGPLVGQQTIYLRGSEGINPTLQRITAFSSLRQNSYMLYPIQEAVGEQVTTHKRGKPLLAGRGRRLTRPTLDP